MFFRLHYSNYLRNKISSSVKLSRRDSFNEKTVSLESSWTVGWSTPSFIIISYLAALITALIHLLLFEFLDKGLAKGPNQKAPQSYVNTSSHILSNAFQLFLQASLSTSFVQYLWLILRRSVLRISIIETLFLIRSDPLSFKWPALKAAPQLISLVFLIWAIYIATIFPPGALTIELANHVANTFVPVPTFNASHIGNGSFVDADKYSLDNLWLYTDRNSSYTLEYISSDSFAGIFPPDLQRLANRIIISGEATAIPSPCGSNCSYTITFDGPYFMCNISTVNSTLSKTPPTIYKGSYSFSNLGNFSEYVADSTNDPSEAVFESSSLSMVASSNIGVIATRENLTCIPYRAQYALQNNYKNGAQNMTVSATPVQPIVSFRGAFSAYMAQQSFATYNHPTPQGDKTASVNWTSIGLQWYRDLNLINIVNVVGMALEGQYNTLSYQNMTAMNTTLPGYGDALWSLENIWNGLVGLPVTGSSGSYPTGPSGGTIIADSKLNDFLRLQLKHEKSPPVISFTITQDLLNDLLINVTLSVITNYGLWNTTANVTAETIVNIYSFSSRNSLILPYGLSLLIALPYVLLGLWALYQNGVSATDGGFIPLITTAGSTSLEKAAQVGRVGGKVSPKFKDMKVRFGELVDQQGESRRGSGDQVVRRAGFGSEKDTLPLERGFEYGRSRSLNSRLH